MTFKLLISIVMIFINLLKLECCNCCKSCKKGEKPNSDSIKNNSILKQKKITPLLNSKSITSSINEKTTTKTFKGKTYNTTDINTSTGTSNIDKTKSSKTKKDEIQLYFKNEFSFGEKNEEVDISKIELVLDKTTNYCFDDIKNNEAINEYLDKIMKLIKQFIKKKELPDGKYSIKKLSVDHSGKSKIIKVNVNNGSTVSFNIYIKNEVNSDNVNTREMFKLFEGVDLLPYKYIIDKDILIIATEDVVQNGYNLLEPYKEDNVDYMITNIYLPTLQKLTNINEFRFFCYLFGCDDIDPYFKYDNFCYKDGKAYSLDLRYSHMVGCYDYDGTLIEFLRKAFRAINTNDEDNLGVGSLTYKTYIESLNNFNGFNEDEKKSINEKLPFILKYIFTKYCGYCYSKELLDRIIPILYIYLKNNLNGKKIKFHNVNGDDIYFSSINEKGAFDLGDNFVEKLKYQFMMLISEFDDSYFISKDNILLIFELYLQLYIRKYSPYSNDRINSLIN